MMNKLLYSLTAGMPCRLIKPEGRPYLERYHVCSLPGGRKVLLHRFVASDIQEAPHNHPGNFLSIVLCGGYDEDVVTDLGVCGVLKKRVRRRWINWIPAKKFHCIVSAKPGTWTLIIRGRNLPGKGWGFLFVRPRRVVFEVAPQSDPYWHMRAPAGRDAGRELL